jgi:hypothetical protein
MKLCRNIRSGVWQLLGGLNTFKMAAVAMNNNELPLQSNSGHYPTPLFWYLGFHGNAILNFINTTKASIH